MAKRRANGEGTIYKRIDGRWEGRITVGYKEDGKAIYKNCLAKTQAECMEKLKILIDNNKKLDFTKSEQFTFSDWMDTWFENYAKIKVRPSSHQTYKGYIENHLKPHFGDTKLSNLTGLQLQSFYKNLFENGRIERKESQNKSKGLSVKTVKNIHQVILSALDVAKTQKLIVENVAKSCELPKVYRAEMRTLSTQDLTKFFEEAKKSGVFGMYYIEIVTGLRRGELLGVKWTDIDYEKRIISVKRQILRINGEIIEAPLKTKNSYRNIPIGADAVEILRQKQENSNSQYVFSNPNGGAISPDSVLNMLHRVLKRAGLPKLRFHDLRHSFSTIALQNGVDIKTLSGILGHFSAGFTLDTYTHVTTQAQQNAANTMGEVVGSKFALL